MTPPVHATVAVGTGHAGVVLEGDATVVVGATPRVRDDASAGDLDPDHVVTAGYGDLERDIARQVAAEADATTHTGAVDLSLGSEAAVEREGSNDVLVCRAGDASLAVAPAVSDLPEGYVRGELARGFDHDALVVGDVDRPDRLREVGERTDVLVTATEVDGDGLSALAAAETLPGKRPVRLRDGAAGSDEDVRVTLAGDGHDVTGAPSVNELLVWDALAGSLRAAGASVDRDEVMRAGRATAADHDGSPGWQELNRGLRERLDLGDDLATLLDGDREATLRRNDLRRRLLTARDRVERSSRDAEGRSR